MDTAWDCKSQWAGIGSFASSILELAAIGGIGWLFCMCQTCCSRHRRWVVTEPPSVVCGLISTGM